MRKQIKYLVSISFIIFTTPSVFATDLVLSLGQTHNITLTGNPNIWIQDREILKAEGQGRRLIVKAGKEGRTTLKVGADVYQVQVLHPNKTSNFNKLQKLLMKTVGLKAEVSDGDLLVIGNLYRLKDWITLADFARKHHLQFQLRTAMSKDLQSQAQAFFRGLITEGKVPPQSIIFTPTTEVRVSVGDDIFKKYQAIFLPFGILVHKDNTSLSLAPTVKVEITIAEIRKDFSAQYGLKWPDSYSAQQSNLQLQLNMLENNGHGKILASPNILCRSGNEAEFLAGGEFPIKVVGYRSESVMWKKYGILLKIKPKADSAGRISLSIETEITTLDRATEKDGIPGVLTNRVSSHFDITRPQTIALSGLLKNDEGKSSQGLPLLSRLPILGMLFASKSYQSGQSELVIFVRPTILKEFENGHGNTHLTDLPEEHSI